MNALYVKKILKNILDIIGLLISRLCGNSVCSDCSRNRIKKKIRICDICQFKITNQDYEQMKADYLKMLDQQNVYLVEQTEGLRMKLQKMRDKQDYLKDQKQDEINKKKEEIKKSEENLKNLQNYIQFKENLIEEKHEGLEKRQEIIQKYQNEVNDLKRDIEFLEIGYNMQLQTKQKKQKQKETLLTLLKGIKKIEQESGFKTNDEIIKEVNKIQKELNFLDNNQQQTFIKLFFKYLININLIVMNKENESQRFQDFNLLNDVKSQLYLGIFQQHQKYIDKSQNEQLSNDEKLNLKIKQLSTAKILVNIHKIDPVLLIDAHLDLALVYKNLEYYEQSYEHNRQALKTLYIEFEPMQELEILYKIYNRLIESCYNLQSYNQTLNYIITFNDILSKTLSQIKFDYSKYFITFINGKTFYCLNELEKAENEFQKALEILKQELDIIYNCNHLDINLDKKNFAFIKKVEILECLYKIKRKEEKNKDQITYIDKIIELCKQNEVENINKIFLFKIQEKFMLKKIRLFDLEIQDMTNSNNKDTKQLEEQKILRQQIFDKYFLQTQNFFSKNKDFIAKDNERQCNNIKQFLLEELNKIKDSLSFQKCFEYTEILIDLEKYFNQEISLEVAYIYFIQAILIILMNQNQNVNILLKKVLKITRTLKYDKIYQKAKSILQQNENGEEIDQYQYEKLYKEFIEKLNKQLFKLIIFGVIGKIQTFILKFKNILSFLILKYLLLRLISLNYLSLLPNLRGQYIILKIIIYRIYRVLILSCF